MDGVDHYRKAEVLVDMDAPQALCHGVLALVALLSDRPWQYADGHPVKDRWKATAGEE